MLTTDDLSLIFAVNPQFFLAAGAIDVEAFEMEFHDGFNNRKWNKFGSSNCLGLKVIVQQAAAVSATDDSRWDILATLWT